MLIFFHLCSRRVHKQELALRAPTYGTFRMEFSNPYYPGFTETIQVSSQKRDFRFQFKELNAEALAESLVK